jgi:transcriptional regulator with XRE-family HTH domain
MKKGLTQDQLAARLQLAGLHSCERVTVAKIESQIRSVYDYELAVLAQVLGVVADEILPSTRQLKTSLDELIAGEQ